MNAMHVQDVFIFKNFINSLSLGLGLLAIYLLFVEKIRPVSDCLLRFLTVSMSCYMQGMECSKLEYSCFLNIL